MIVDKMIVFGQAGLTPAESITMLNGRTMERRLVACVCLLTGCFLAAPLTSAQAGGSTHDLEKSQTLLFVDNHDILYYAGVQRKLSPLTRHPNNPLIRGEEKPWEHDVAYCSVYKHPDTDRYQMWYQSYVGGNTPDKSLRCVVCYAESQDGIHWEKPDLDLHPFYDIKRTNIVLLSNEGHSVHYGASVIVDPGAEDSARNYKMAYWDFVKKDGKEIPGLCIAFSPDGIHWTKYGKNPVLRGAYGDREQPPLRNALSSDDHRPDAPKAFAISDVIDVIRDPVRQRFVIYSKTWIDGPEGKMFWKRAVARTESTDFIHWSRPQLVIWPDELDNPETMLRLVPPSRAPLPANKREKVSGAQLHSGPAFYYNGLYFSLLQTLDLDVTGLMPAELAISRDGLNWRRPFRKDFFLPVDGGDHFDSGTLWTNATPIHQKDETWFYYGAYIAWHSELPQYDGKLHSGIGLATMPKDRFAGLQTVENVGQVTLKPLDLSNCRAITLNAEVKSGSVRVELLDQDGFRLEGFSREESVPITKDGLRHKVLWKNKKLSQLSKGKYLLRIHLDHATLYAVTLLN